MSRLSNAIGAFKYAWTHYDEVLADKYKAHVEAVEKGAQEGLKVLNASDGHFASSFINNLPKMDREDVKRFMEIVETLPQETQYWLITKAACKAPGVVSTKPVFDWCKKNAGWARAFKKRQENPEAQPSE